MVDNGSFFSKRKMSNFFISTIEQLFLKPNSLQIRQGYQYEGEVLYFLDNKGSVLGLLKKKTVW